MIKKYLTLIFLIKILFVTSLYCQIDSTNKVVKIHVQADKEMVVPGDTVKIEIKASIREGYHINSHKPSLGYLRATTIELQPIQGVKFSEIIYPNPKQISLSYSDKKLDVYEDEVVFTVSALISPEVKLKRVKIKGTITYQPCNATSCLFTQKKNFDILIKVK